MTLQPRVLTIACALLGLGMSGIVNAQTEERDRAKMKAETTVAGCLSKGEAADEYVLTDPKSGTKLTVKGIPELDKHSANHTVKLTGISGEDGKSFTATKLVHVSDTCDTTKQ